MIEALLVSNALLWIAVVLLGLLVVALTRQVGVLHERVAPVGALAASHGPAVGDRAPEMRLPGIDGTSIQLGGSEVSGRRTLLFFLSSSCPVCETLLPTLARIARAESPGLRVVYASDGAPEEHVEFRRAHGLEGKEYVLSTDLGMRYEVAKLPYAVLLDAEGRVRAKGLVNTREHLESLFEAERLKVASLQDYLARERAVEVASGQGRRAMTWLDAWFEGRARRVARGAGRRSFLGRVGALLVGGAVLPLLPVARARAQGARVPAPNEDIEGPEGDEKRCEYWRHCAIDGALCACCGGSATQCPPGTEVSPVTWVGTCRNPSDGKHYLISYNDCCGKNICGRCICNRNEGERPEYHWYRNNDINWCAGAKPQVYNCSVAVVIGQATEAQPEQ